MYSAGTSASLAPPVGNKLVDYKRKMEQEHLIKKQIIEIRVGKNHNASSLQEEFSKMYHQKIVPYINECCNELSHPGTTHKINQIELDIGIVSPDGLEAAFEEKLKPALQRKLAEKIEAIPPTFSIIQPTSEERGKQGKQKGSELEMLTYFIQTGLLPWWSKKQDKASLEKKLEELIETTPSQIKNLIKTSVKNTVYLKRLIFHFSDALLLKISGLMAPPLFSFIKEYWHDLPQITKIEIFQDIPENKLRFELWSTLLLNVSVDSWTSLQEELFVQQHLSHLTKHLQINYAIMIRESLKQVNNQPRKYPFKSNLPQIIAGLNTTSTAKQSQKKQGLPTAVKQFTQLQEQLQALQKYDIALFAPLIAQLQKKVQALQKRKETASIPQEITALQEQVRELEERIHAAITTQLKELQEQLNAFLKQGNTKGIKQLKEKIQRLQEKQLQKKTDPLIEEGHLPEILNNTFNQSDEVYINNAGLVLLWPFITRFFQTIELVTEKTFTDEVDVEALDIEYEGSNRERAALLLQYLVDGSTITSEHELPLNKILCGIDLMQPVNTELMLTEQEKEESENLLVAVSANNPLWKNLSTEGLQSAYLQREGVLSFRDGSPWLQVEKKTHDITLEQLPWGTHVIKLPWMEHILYAEW